MNTLMDRLKDSTRERHARMEALPFVAALTSGELPLNSYVAQLRAMAIIHGTLDHELRYIPLTPLTALCESRPSRLAHLRADLGAFDRTPVPDCLESVRYAQEIAEVIRITRLDHPENLLAFLYVLEGTTLGNAVHYPDVIKNFGEKVSGATHYYAGYGENTGQNWQEFRSVMNTLAIDDAGCEQMIQTVHALFDLLEPLFTALYPVCEEGWGFTASMLNPEAGNHPVPGSEAEIKAAIAAARRCRQEFPYFDERYGERGKDFAKSDVAWLVTLTLLPQTQLVSQVEWLGRVLGNRGMPRITLERQLELLYEELISVVPEQQKRYGGLREAAARLKSERNHLIPESAFGDLAKQFHTATSSERHETLRAGELIVSAVCDEAGGITEALTSLVSWLTDRQRFSEQWIAAVAGTVAQTRNKMILP
jgi:heme oxygenase